MCLASWMGGSNFLHVGTSTLRLWLARCPILYRGFLSKPQLLLIEEHVRKNFTHEHLSDKWSKHSSTTS